MAAGSLGPEVRRFADLDALSRAAAEELMAIVRAAVVHRGTCSIALSGGSTPKRLFQLLAQAGRDALPWEHVDLWWGDERTVPPDHADSNYRMTHETLIDPLGLAASHVHRIAGELPDHDAAARAYERALVAALGSPPIFDLVMLGMGPDGHCASLFPGSPALGETARWVVANPVTSPLVHGSTTRITLTAPALNAARHIRFYVGGADKAATLAHVLEGERDPVRYPSQLIAPHDGELVWFVDTAAAAALRGAA
ncbi:MAG TPA: 6-phosphogluconolactonase [Kofleriaceae bacterium]|jgi:6-phosphogluconolactonase|nr:6-phosphogluconolactonase [Kofleriaceae bacterium]